MLLQKNEQAFLEEALKGVRGYRSVHCNPDSSLFEDNEDVTWSLQGIIIDAAHFNKVEDTAYDTLLMALAQSLGDTRPEGLFAAVKLIEGAIDKVLEQNK